MKQGIYINPHDFVELGELSNKRELSCEIASRSKAWDWTDLTGLLPDPDPILQKMGQGVEVLESLTSDGHLCGVIQQRKLGSLKKEYRWEPGTVGDDEPTEQAKKLCEALREDMKGIDVYNLLSAMLDTPYYGMSPFELIWEPDSSRIKLKDVRALPCRWFGFDAENEIRFKSLDQPEEGEEIPYGKAVIARHFPTYDNPYGLRLLSRCFWPVAFKKGGIKFWLMMTEKYGMPFLLGKYRQGATEAEQQEMLDRLNAMVKSAVAVIMEGGSIEMLDAKGKGASADLYKGLKDAMDYEMSKVIVGQTLTSQTGEDGGGSYALGKEHGDVLNDFRIGDQKLVKNSMNRIAEIYAAVNAPGVEPPEFFWFEEEDPKKEFAERDKTVSETGVKFTKEYYVRRYGYKEDEFEISTTPQSPPDPGGEDKSEFAEHKGGKRFSPQQQAIEELVEKVTKLAAGALEGNEKLLMDIVLKAESYEEAFAALLEAYPQLKTDELEEVVFQSGLNAHLFGRYTVQEEGKE
ncbi:MAG: DUF935 domain-containing protein [Deltaproteobacteria bacterium]|nr:DUF935 domain-containing protein [Deltaproteobacteria bacterium]